MKIRIGATILFLLAAGAWYFFALDHKKGIDQVYLLPEGFKGCAVIFYDKKDAPPLKIENNEITYEFPETGILYTSSPMEFGWANKENSGAYQLRAFYIDENGNKISAVSDGDIRFGATGSFQEEGKKEQTFYYQIFGDEKTEDLGCPAVDI
jgi:hypothetical protein